MTCPRCGAAWTPGWSYCTRCGLPGQGAAPPWTSGAQAPQRRPGAGVWLLVALAVIFVMGATAATTAWFVSQQDAGTSEAGPSIEPPPADAATRTPESSEVPEAATPETSDPPPSPSAAPDGNFASMYEDVESGVLRILATTCEGDGIGTGFLIGQRTLATAAHVVEGADGLAVTVGDDSYGAEVIGIDPVTDLALVRLDAPVQGHIFDFASEDPTPGTDVAAIGFPLNEPKTLTVGTVSGLDRTIDIDGVPRSGLLQTDTAVNPGNSGGPLVTSQGEVVGVVDALRLNSQGISYAVQVSVAAPALQQGVGMEEPAPAVCGSPQAPDQLSVAPRLMVPPDPTASAVRTTLREYYNSINEGDYYRVLEQYAPGYRENFTAEELARGLATSFDFDVTIRDVTQTAAGAQAWVTFTSVQSPRFGPENESCTRWSLDYDFTRVGDRLLISGVETHSGDGHEVC